MSDPNQMVVVSVKMPVWMVDAFKKLEEETGQNRSSAIRESSINHMERNIDLDNLYKKDS